MRASQIRRANESYFGTIICFVRPPGVGDAQNPSEHVNNLVQATVLSGGTKIVKNFRDKAFLCPRGVAVQPMGYVVTGR